MEGPVTYPKTLRDYAKALGMDVGCMDSGCIWGGPGGMSTNAGCRCLGSDAIANRLQARSLARVAKYLATMVSVRR